MGSKCSDNATERGLALGWKDCGGCTRLSRIWLSAIRRSVRPRVLRDAFTPLLDFAECALQSTALGRVGGVMYLSLRRSGVVTSMGCVFSTSSVTPPAAIRRALPTGYQPRDRSVILSEPSTTLETEYVSHWLGLCPVIRAVGSSITCITRRTNCDRREPRMQVFSSNWAVGSPAGTRLRTDDDIACGR